MDEPPLSGAIEDVAVESTATSSRGSFRSAWRHRRWRWLLGSVVVSLAGDFLYWIALVAFLASADGGAGWVAAALIVRLVPYIVLGPVGGAFADRFDRRRLLISLDLTRAAIFVLLAMVIATDAPRTAAIVLVGLSAIAGTIYRPTIVAVTPQLVTEHDLGAANAAEASLSQLSWFVGPALGALLVTVMDASWVVALDAGTFVVSALMISRIGRLPARTDTSDAASSGWLSQSTAGFARITEDRGVLALAAVAVAALVCFGAEQVLYVLVAVERLDLGPEGVGVLMAAMGVGGLLVAPFTARIGSSARLDRWFLAATAAGCASLATMSLVDSRVVAVALAAVEGGAMIIFEIGLVTLLQRAVDDGSLGRVYGTLDALGALGEVSGTLLGPILAAGLGLGVALAASGLIGVVVVIVAAPALTVLAQRLEQERRELHTMTEWFGGVDGLSAFEPVDRERLARSAALASFEPGDDVVREGDTPDDLYVVRAGTLTVESTATTRSIPDLGAGDLFGEIGLLQGIPRTATVSARDHVELVRIDGAVFADVATGRLATSPLDRSMRGRLDRTHPHLLRASEDGPATGSAMS